MWSSQDAHLWSIADRPTVGRDASPSGPVHSSQSLFTCHSLCSLAANRSPAGKASITELQCTPDSKLLQKQKRLKDWQINAGAIYARTLSQTYSCSDEILAARWFNFCGLWGESHKRTSPRRYNRRVDICGEEFGVNVPISPATLNPPDTFEKYQRLLFKPLPLNATP